MLKESAEKVMQEGVDGANISFLISKHEWLNRYKPETAEEAFDLLYEQHDKQAERMIAIVETLTASPQERMK